MTKDFKQSTPQTKKQYGISWMLGGIGVGLLAGLAIFTYFNQSQKDGTAPVVAEQSAQNTTPQAETRQAVLENKPVQEQKVPEPEPSRPAFNYHAILPQISMDESMSTAKIKETNPEPGVANQLGAIAGAIDQPLANAPTAAEVQPQVPTPTVQQPGNYMFQLGSYRSQDQAIQMQQRAQRNGMNTRIEQANVNGQTWYRVRIGPTSDLNIANRWRQSISSMGVEPYLIRM